MTDTERSRTMTVLIVEDDETWASVLTRYLTARQCDVTLLTSSEGALERITEASPDLILLDLKLPDDGGPALIAGVSGLGDDIRSRTAIVTAYSNVAEAWTDGLRVIDKTALSELGAWIDSRITERHGTGIRASAPK